MLWAESPRSTKFYMDSAKMHHKQILCIHFHQHLSLGQLHGALQPGRGSIPQPSSAAQKRPLRLGPWVLAFRGGLQGNAEAVSYLITKRHFTLLQAVFLSLLPASVTPCSWASWPSMPDNSVMTNYICWAVTVRISLSQPKYDFLASWIRFLLYPLSRARSLAKYNHLILHLSVGEIWFSSLSCYALYTSRYQEANSKAV